MSDSKLVGKALPAERRRGFAPGESSDGPPTQLCEEAFAAKNRVIEVSDKRREIAPGTRNRRSPMMPLGTGFFRKPASVEDAQRPNTP